MQRTEHAEIVDAPLEVQVIDREIVLMCSPLGVTSLTRDAAIETGIRLVNAAIGIEET